MAIKRDRTTHLRGMSRIRTGGPRTTPPGTTPRQQRRKSNSPTKYRRKG